MIKDILQKLGLHKKDPLQIHGYQTYGTDNHLYALGRALEYEGVNLNKKGLLNAFKNAYNQFRSDELPGARLRLTLGDGRIFYTTTDADGYYNVDLNTEDLFPLTNDLGWVHVELSYEDYDKNRVVHNNNRFSSQMLIPQESAEYGIISDIDDTILQTGVTSLMKWRVIINTLFRGVGKRTPLSGAANLYQKLSLGKSGKASNPFFYVSNSPWNLYHYLESFIKHNNFPKGAILLRNFGEVLGRSPAPEKPHKQHEIRNILDTYPHLDFILIGDSGEHDADIYLEIAQEFPERIKAVYLRSVNHENRMIRVRGVLEEFKEVPALMVKESKAAEDHAREVGLIA